MKFENKLIYTSHNHNTKDMSEKIASFVLGKGYLPVDPFLVFPPFCLDSFKMTKFERLALDMKMLSRCDELWVFGAITYGVGKETEWWKKNRPSSEIRYFSWQEL